MKAHLALRVALFAGAIVFIQSAVADTPELSTPPASDAEKEAAYTLAIENRTTDILKLLAVTEATKSNTVHDVIVAQYRALRARDAVIDAKLKADGKETSYANRAGQLAAASKPLHDSFLTKLAETLAPEQVEQVKDGMTYKKVKVTFDAYGAIVPNLTDTDKAKITELLKLAREEAMDGGNAPGEVGDFSEIQGADQRLPEREWPRHGQGVQGLGNQAGRRRAQAGRTGKVIPAGLVARSASCKNSVPFICIWGASLRRCFCFSPCPASGRCF